MALHSHFTAVIWPQGGSIELTPILPVHDFTRKSTSNFKNKLVTLIHLCINSFLLSCL